MALECHHNRRYIYDDLQDADAMIRVAKIRGGNFDDPIVVSFVVRELQVHIFAPSLHAIRAQACCGSSPTRKSVC